MTENSTQTSNATPPAVGDGTENEGKEDIIDDEVTESSTAPTNTPEDKLTTKLDEDPLKDVTYESTSISKDVTVPQELTTSEDSFTTLTTVDDVTDGFTTTENSNFSDEIATEEGIYQM